MTTNFCPTYISKAEFDAACELAADEIYSTPVFKNNTLAAYAVPLMLLDECKLSYPLASKAIAQAFSINQIRLIELHMIITKHADS